MCVLAVCIPEVCVLAVCIPDVCSSCVFYSRWIYPGFVSVCISWLLNYLFLPVIFCSSDLLNPA